MSTMRRATITRTNPTGPPTFVQVERYLGDGYRIIGRPAGFIIIGGEDAGDATLDAILKRLAADGITAHEIAPCDPQCNGPHELTRNQLEEAPDGTVLWCDKLPVRRVQRGEGDVTLHDGTLTWLSRPGELTWEPRPDAGRHCSRGRALPHGESLALERISDAAHSIVGIGQRAATSANLLYSRALDAHHHGYFAEDQARMRAHADEIAEAAEALGRMLADIRTNLGQLG